MTTPKTTPADAIARQMADIRELAEHLLAIDAECCNAINPDTATWADVGTYAMEADLANALLAQLRGEA